MSYCLKGSILFTIDGIDTLIRTGETIVIPSNAVHGVKAMELKHFTRLFYSAQTGLTKSLISIGTGIKRDEYMDGTSIETKDNEQDTAQSHQIDTSIEKRIAWWREARCGMLSMGDLTPF